MPKRKHYNSSDEDDPYGSASDDDGDYKRKKKPAAKKAKKTPTPKKVSTKTTVATDTITKSPIALPNFSEEDVLKIVGKGSFMKGQEIYDKNYISELVYVKEADPVQLTCVCKATSGSPYNLKLTFKNDFKKKTDDDTDANTLYDGACTCPVGTEGKCKHSVALLFALLESEGNSEKKPDRFARSAEDESAIKSKINEISHNSVATLKDLLKMNDQSAGKNKQELLEKVADGMLFGALPRCPKCAGGRLRVLGNMYTCPGFMEDDTFQDCDYVSMDIKRIPWKTSK